MKSLLKFVSILRVPDYRTALLRHGVAAGVEHQRALGRLPTRTVVDVGANRGQFTLFSRHAFPAAHIVSLEPLPAPAAVFLRLFEDDPLVVFHRVALGAKGGEATIHVSGHDDSSSLFPIGERQSALFPGTGETRTESVLSARLSEVIGNGVIAKPALLKLDVQGYELEVLRGAENVLDEFNWVYAECSFVELYDGQALADEVISWLLERGFRVRTVDNISRDRDGLAVQADILFARQ